MLKKIGYESIVTSNPQDLSFATKIILPGVGAFDPAIEKIDQLGFRDVLNELILKKNVPVLGICLGMQLLTLGSEEGESSGLGYIDAFTRRFPQDKSYKVPHMGWNNVLKKTGSCLTDNLTEDCRFYFVHSYHVIVNQQEDSVLKCKYGLEFDAAISRGNVYGVQFHPEKSHKYGMHLLKNFIEKC